MRRAVKRTGLRWETCTGPHIWRNRNNLVGGAEWYLFWDADIVPADPRRAIRQLLNRKRSIVGGAYIQRGAEHYCAAVNDRGHVSQNSTGIHSVDWVGAGFLLVHQSVFDTCPKPWFRHEFVGDDQTPEDIGFCMNARRNGFKVYVDCDVKLEHIGG